MNSKKHKKLKNKNLIISDLKINTTTFLIKMHMFKTKSYYIITILVFFTVLSFNAIAEEWNIPADKKAKNSNIQFTPAIARQGEDIFTKNCVSCHGNPGKNNSLKSLTPIPPDLSGAKTQQRTDGDLFYIITTGRMIMPSFANVLSEDERWKIISYIRSFNKNYVQVVSKFDSNKSKLVKIDMSFDSKSKIIKVVAAANEDTGKVKLHDDEISLFVNRYFGRLQIENSVKTNEAGEAEFQFPTDLPGDKDGNVELIVKMSDDKYGEIESISKLKIGIPTYKPSLTQNRAIWNVGKKAPYWILFTYLICVLIVISTFTYIIYNLYNIFKIGKIKK
jgi:mono/diheme cytochrome c family protein